MAGGLEGFLESERGSAGATAWEVILSEEDRPTSQAVALPVGTALSTSQDSTRTCGPCGTKALSAGDRFSTLCKSMSNVC